MDKFTPKMFPGLIWFYNYRANEYLSRKWNGFWKGKYFFSSGSREFMHFSIFCLHVVLGLPFSICSMVYIPRFFSTFFLLPYTSCVYIKWIGVSVFYPLLFLPMMFFVSVLPFILYKLVVNSTCFYCLQLASSLLFICQHSQP